MGRRAAPAGLAEVVLCTVLIASGPIRPAHTQIVQQPTLRVDVELVNVSFTVQDENGAYQTHLAAEDFLLLEDGVPQRIQFFSRELETPLTLAVVLDLSGSQGKLIPGDIEAAARFFKRILDPRDRALVVAFGPPPLMTFMTSRVRLIRDFTPSGADVDQAVRDVEALYRRSPNLGPKSRAGSSPVLDSLYYTASEKMRNAAGRKAVLLISDGEDTCSRQTVGAVIEMLQSADTILYTLHNTGNVRRLKSGHTQPSRLDRITLETGGQQFTYAPDGLNTVFDRIEDEPRSTYTIGYVSSNRLRDGTFRRIEIRVNRPGWKVKARAGYRAPKS